MVDKINTLYNKQAIEADTSVSLLTGYSSIGTSKHKTY